MRFSGRAMMCVVVMLGATGAFSSCSDKATSGGEDPPVTANDILQVASTGTTALTVLANDTNLTHEPLKLTIEDAPAVGSASFNTDNTVRLDLPAGFRGVTRFRYKITNSVGGFSIAAAAVFVDVPAYRVLFAASNSTQPTELYVNDFTATKQLSQAVSGNFRLRNMWRSEGGGLVAYSRADPAQAAATLELYTVRTKPIASPVKVTKPVGRNYVELAPVAISPDDRWIAYVTSPASNGGRNNDLYVLDTSSASSSVAVGLSENIVPALTQWVDANTVYFMSAPGNGTLAAVYRASVGSFDAPVRVSPFYSTTDTTTGLVISPDQSALLLVGVHNGQSGAYLVDPTNLVSERRLTTDIPSGATLESYRVDDAVTEITYLWRAGTASNARLSTADIADSGTPRLVIDTDINALGELNHDGTAALVTRGSGGSASDGTLFEVSLDRSTADVRVAANVTTGVYDDTGDNVFLFSRTLAPSVIARADFERTPSALVRTNTAPSSLYMTPLIAESTAIIEDSTSGLVQVNATAPGKTYRLTTLGVGNVVSGLNPTAIEAAQ